MKRVMAAVLAAGIAAGCGDGPVVRSGLAVSFTQAADTFFRDADFRFSGNRLTGTHTDGDGTMRVTLTRQ